MTLSPPNDEKSPERWNLLSDAAGQTWPALEDALAADGRLVLVSNEEELEVEHVDEDDELLTPVLLRPGEAMAAAVSNAIERALAECWGSDRIAAGACGFAPLPYSTEGWKIQGGITGVGHPVFWLPHEVRTFDDIVWVDPAYAYWESTLEQIRLWFELAARGYADLETGDVVDVLVANAINPLSEPWASLTLDVTDSDGERPQICRQLVLPLPDGASSARVASWWAATRAVDHVQQMHELIVTAQLNHINIRLFAACEVAEKLSVAIVMAAYEEAGKQYAEQPSEATLGDLLEAVGTTVDRIDAMAFENCFYLEEIAEMRERGFNPADDEAAHEASLEKRNADTEKELRDLADGVRQLIAATRGRPQAEIPDVLTTTWNELATTAHRWLVRFQEIASYTHPVERSEFTVPPPPPLEVPADVRPEIERIQELAAAAQ